MDELELIKEKINIVDLIGEYITLKKAGVNYKANCPFHQEHTPSFMVSPERQIWHCFGCDKGGDIFKFVMEKEGLEFRDAIEFLAQKAGVVLKKTQSAKSKGQDRLYDANQKAQQFFAFMLTDHPLGKKSLEYLYKRGLTDQTIKEFGIGYAPQNWEALTKFLRKRGFSESEIIDSGLAVPSQKGCYDRFRGRIMFPLIDIRGRIIGFSGRILDQGEPKYINSPQTPIFDKKRFLFGLNLSKSAIKEAKEAIVTEGEMDMIMSYQSGVKNVVASKGTAFTEEHIESLKKYTDTLSLCFDTDLAGDAASRRGIEIADKAGMNLKVIQVVGGKDPGEVCLKDPDSWKKSVAEAVPIYDYYLQSAQKRYDTKKADQKRALFTELLPIWRKISDPLIKEHYIQRLSALLEIKDELIREQINKPEAQIRAEVVKSEVKKPVTTKKIESYDRRKLLEEYLIVLLLHLPAEYTFVPNFPETLFTDEELKQLYVLLVLYLDHISFKSRGFKIGEFVQTVPSELTGVVDKLYLTQVDEKLTDQKNWQKEIEEVVGELKKMLIKSSLEKLSLQIKNAQEFEKVEQLQVLTKRFRDLSVKLRNL